MPCRSIALALGLFTLCWGPYYSALFLFVLFGVPSPPLVQFCLLWIAMSNSYMNFFVFVATYRSFRVHFMQLVGFRNRVSGIDVTTTRDTVVVSGE